MYNLNPFQHLLQTVNPLQAQQSNSTYGAQNPSFSQQAAQQYSAAQGMTPHQIAMMYNNQLWQQTGATAQYNHTRMTYNWVWNGTPCTVEEFAELAYGDTPERTHFILKHKGIDE